MNLYNMNDEELLEYILDLFDSHIIVWQDREGHYQPKSTKQELYKKIYDFRIGFHNAMAMRKISKEIDKMFGETE